VSGAHPALPVKRLACLLSFLGLVSISANNVVPPAAHDHPVPHHQHQPFPLPSETAQDVRTLAIDRQDRVWAATRGGLFEMPADRSGWRQIAADKLSGPLFDLAVDASGSLWIAAWNGLHKLNGPSCSRIPGLETPVRALACAPELVITGGPAGFHRLRDNSLESWDPGSTRYLNRIRAAPDGTLWFATGMGLFQFRDGHRREMPVTHSG
jgi:ligand-binding sensor domain-containing protein